MSLQFAFFSILAVFAIASGIFTITQKNPLASAIGLIFHFFMLAGLYLTLQAQFLAVVQIMVYAGAIMVLIVFVIMLLNLGDEKGLRGSLEFKHFVAILLAGVFALQLVVAFLIVSSGKEMLSDKSLYLGTVEVIGAELYTNYILPVISIAVLLTAAILGAVVLAKKNLNGKSEVKN
jgi:NADH-quinone oxidoreductase subunit J